MLAASRAFVQLVFANEGDTCYCDDLRKLNLKRYLWFRLHEYGYQVVYFISEEKSTKKLKAANYGERTAKSYPGRTLLELFAQSEDESFVRWIGQLLSGGSGSERNAVVFPLELFCRLKDRVGNIAEILNPKICNGSIFLIVPPEKESIRRLTKKKSIFDALQTMYILDARNEPTGDYCRFLETKSRNGGMCLFLHTYTKDRLTVLLKHIVLEYFERFVSEDALAAMGEYLAYYLNNRFLQLEETIFEPEFDLRMPQYEDLYRQLRKEKVWKALSEKAAAIPAGQSVAEYVGEIAERYSVNPTRKLRSICSQDSLEYRCMRLSPRDPAQEEENSFIDRIRHRRNLDTLWRNSCRIGNHEPNPEIYGKMLEYLDKLDVQVSQFAADCMTCRRLVYALSLFSEHLYNRSLTKEQVCQMILYLDYYIVCSEKLHTVWENYSRSLENGGSGMSDLVIRQNERAYCAVKRQFTGVENGLPQLIDQLTGKSVLNDDEKLAQDALEILKEWAQQYYRADLREIPRPEPESEKEPEQETVVIYGKSGFDKPKIVRGTPGKS